MTSESICHWQWDDKHVCFKLLESSRYYVRRDSALITGTLHDSGALALKQRVG
jgi:hypothetical protein